MKKHTFCLVGAFVLLAQSLAHANAPALRGVYTPLNAPNSATNSATELQANPIGRLPTPKVLIANAVLIPTKTIHANQSGSKTIDSALIDDFISDVSPNALHYPPNFPNRTAQHNTGENIKYLSAWLKPYADAKDASFEILLRATKINAIGRNLNLGTEYGVLASDYINRALQMQPDHPEANFLYGIMLAEGGGFAEGEKYLNKAAAAGYVAAEQSLAQSALLNDQKDQALRILRRLQSAHPNNAQIQKQVQIVESGGYYIWDLEDNDVSVKPLTRQN